MEKSKLIKVGDTFDLTVDAISTTSGLASYLSQTIVLSRSGSLVAFTVQIGGGAPTVPVLGAWGFTVEDIGLLCDNPRPSCGYRSHAARVTFGGQPETVAPNQTVTIQGLSFTVGRFDTPIDNGGGCTPTTTMAGFRRL